MEPAYTRTQGQYLAFIHYYTKIHGVAPAEADLQRYVQTSPPSIHNAINTGLITSATNNDAISVIDRVTGKYHMNSPITPGQPIMGIKAATVVAVEAIMGMATSEVAFFEAFILEYPS